MDGCMLDPETFDPRDLRYKAPYGAVPAGTLTEFTLRPLRQRGYIGGRITARLEARGDFRLEAPLCWSGLEGSRDLFSGCLDTGDYVGLCWYSLRLFRLDGSLDETPELQLTVYDGGETVPAWFGAGMSYQIFPDRFCRTRVPFPEGLVGGRWVHSNWEEGPEYRPDQKGEIRNRDFFGGNLAGVMEKLPYIKSLGTETIYFCPIFEAAENHRYGTADYEKIDPMLGTNEEFTALCAAAHRLGMRVMLDGVFNHTGFVSKYFNGDGFYPEPGAYQRQDSAYSDWFSFQHWNDKYSAWWGIYSMPTTNKNSPSWLEYITGENGIIRSWLRAGADGWRLDVADELPDFVVHAIHAAARAERKDAVIIGEVWEDGSTKIAYSVRRKHVLGGHCDGLMNYPFRNALMAFLLGGGGENFKEELETLREHYPKFATYSAMNALGTHDTPRILTLLGTGNAATGKTKAWRADYRMTPEERSRGLARLRLGAMVLFAFPGSPTLYYGDEAGMEGFEDPFNRQTFPWGHEDLDLTAYFTALGRARQKLEALRGGDIAYVRAEGHVLAFTRSLGGQTVLCAVNAGNRSEVLTLPWTGTAQDPLGGEAPLLRDGSLTLHLPPMTGRLICN
ncbi:MAG: glycoside hydrolase family 13 protein [Pseudoflavonifractor sp.]